MEALLREDFNKKVLDFRDIVPNCETPPSLDELGTLIFFPTNIGHKVRKNHNKRVRDKFRLSDPPPLGKMSLKSSIIFLKSSLIK